MYIEPVRVSLRDTDRRLSKEYTTHKQTNSEARFLLWKEHMRCTANSRCGEYEFENCSFSLLLID